MRIVSSLSSALAFTLATAGCAGSRKQMPSQVIPPAKVTPAKPPASGRLASDMTASEFYNIPLQDIGVMFHANWKIFQSGIEHWFFPQNTSIEKKSVVESNSEEEESALDSDMPLEELYQTVAKQERKYIIVIFHAKWCEPCKVIKTDGYQSEIEAFNRKESSTLLVTMSIDRERSNAKLNFFLNKLPLSWIPSALFIRTKDSRYYIRQLSSELRESPLDLTRHLQDKRFKQKDSLTLPVTTVQATE